MEAKLENWYVTGLRQENIVPSLVASIGDSRSSLLKIEFNINPEESTADQSLSIESQPVEIKYDAVSSNQNCSLFCDSFFNCCFHSLCSVRIYFVFFTE